MKIHHYPFHYLVVLLLITLLSSCSNTSTQVAKNSSIKSGELWLDNQGKHINAHGGGIIYDKGSYYWFGEYKSDSTSSALVGVTCYSSKDLYNWKNEGIALAVSQDTSSDIVSGCIIERPKVVFNEKTKKYVMWFHLELKNQGYNAARTAVAISDRVTGPYTYLHSLRPNKEAYPINMTENEKHLTFDINKYPWWSPKWYECIKEGMFFQRDFKEGQMSRDMTIFVDDDKKAYQIYSSEDNLTLQISELSDDYLHHIKKFIRIFPTGHNEAPALFKKDGTYWMITSGCTGWKPNEARMFSAKNIWGPWTQYPNPCVGENAQITFGAQSTYILNIHGTQQYLFMGDIWRPQHPIDARYLWLPIAFNDGIPELRYQKEWKIENEHNK